MDMRNDEQMALGFPKNEPAESNNDQGLVTRTRSEVDLLLDGLATELQWCGGSSDFNDGGQARKGWLKGPAVVLDHYNRFKEQQGRLRNAGDGPTSYSNPYAGGVPPADGRDR